MTVQAELPAVPRRRILFIHYAGDYREGYNQIVAGGQETYRSQRYSIETTARLGRDVGEVGVLCCIGNEPYDEMMKDGVRAIGAGLSERDFRPEPIIDWIKVFRATHLIVKGPFYAIMLWAIQHGMDVLPCLADSFTLSTIGLSPMKALNRAVRHHFHCRQVAKVLNAPRIRWVSNHNIVACRDLVRIGVDPRKIVPWDWLQTTTPEMYEPKSRPAEGSPWHLIYVGGISERKGVGDALEAVAKLKRRGRKVDFRAIGRGDIDHFAQLARTLDVADCVRFEGLQPNAQVIEAMQASDLVLIPSRHAYPEGLPNVFFEAFATRTPVICSDHPMFKGIVREEAAMFVPENNPVACANAVETILGNPTLYRRMSAATEHAWHHFQCPVLWHELLDHWLGATPDDDRWLAGHSLASGRYPAK